ncbi:MAG: hypothetical protein U5Q16_12375 [Gammaproteobacteria bacterium]|nr:hypothetical protein [Gammaproteobacteria bacterium]
MIWKYTAVLGAGVLVAGLAVPMSASAHAEDNALAFVIGAAVGHAINDNDSHVRKVHRRHADYGPHARYGRYDRYHHRPGKAYGKYKKWQHKKWQHKKWQHRKWHAKRQHHGYGHDRRYDRKHHKRGHYWGHDRYRGHRGDRRGRH